ncbi:MAG TPA: DUF2280 domain-containing protein [Hyphomicrobium sp.]|nr:DUF2280 domain-containing protein [Hyphomicrobium sp.]
MKKHNRKLTEEAQSFVVCALACFDTPAAVAAAVKREFGVAVRAQSIEAYDPTKRAGKRLSLQWRELFAATREKFQYETASVGVAHRSVRLRKLDRMVQAAEDGKDYVLAAALLEQAAKEMGNVYTNHRVLSGPQGRPMQVQTITSTMTQQEAADAYAAQLNGGPSSYW